MRKILLIMLLSIIAICAVPGIVTADNEIVLDDFELRSYESSSYWYREYLLLEIDFTQGNSALVNINVEVTAKIPMSVLLVRYAGERWYSQGSIPIFVTVDSTFTAERVYSYKKQFTMTPYEWDRGTYYFLIWGNLTHGKIYVDVDFSVMIDYDGDGVYAHEDMRFHDINPTTNDTWMKEIKNRLSGIDTSISLNYKWVMENITELSSSLTDKAKEIYSNLDTLQSNLEERMVDIEVNATLTYLLLMENISTLTTELRELDDVISLSFFTLLSKYQWAMENVTELQSDLSDLSDFKSNIEYEVWNQAIDLEELQKSLVVNITSLLLLLSTLGDEIRESCDSMNETTDSIKNDLLANIEQQSKILNFTIDSLGEFGMEFEGKIVAVNDRVDDVEIEFSNVSNVFEFINYNLSDIKIAQDLGLKSLNDTDKENNDARIQDILANAEQDQKDLDKALKEAKSARNAGVIFGSIGILVGMIALIIGSRRPNKPRG